MQEPSPSQSKGFEKAHRGSHVQRGRLVHDTLELPSRIARHSAEQYAQLNVAPPTAMEVAERFSTLVLPTSVNNPMVELLKPFWSSAKLQQEFKASRQALDSRMRVGSLLGLKTGDGQLVFPAFQFIRDTKGGLKVRPGVIDMLKIVRTSEGYEPWTFATLLRTPAPEREDLTPIEWMRDSDQDQRALRDLALRWVHEWSR